MKKINSYSKLNLLKTTLASLTNLNNIKGGPVVTDICSDGGTCFKVTVTCPITIKRS